jgi:hypothetical protein
VCCMVLAVFLFEVLIDSEDRGVMFHQLLLTRSVTTHKIVLFISMWSPDFFR